MSLTFRRVPQISKRRCGSESKSRPRYIDSFLEASDQIDTHLDEFPSLRGTIQVTKSAIFGSQLPTFDLLTSGFKERFSNGLFLNSIENKCFEEDRWNSYQSRGSNHSYSQYLIRNKFCCQKNRNAYCSKLDTSTVYKKSIANILDEFREKRDAQCVSQPPSINSPHGNNPNRYRVNSTLPFNFAPNIDTISRQSNDYKKLPEPALFNSIFYTPFEYSNASAPTATTKNQRSCANIPQKPAPSVFNPVPGAQRSQINISLAASFPKVPLIPRTKTVKLNLSAIVNASEVQIPCSINNGFQISKYLTSIKENASNAETRPVKARSIHTINESPKEAQVVQQKLPFPTNSQVAEPTMTYFNQPTSQSPEHQSELFPNTSWFLQENLSNQFGFSSILNRVSPVFQEGNLYAECYDFPTVPAGAFSTMMPIGTSVLRKKKDFKAIFSPYRRDKSLSKTAKKCLLFE